MKISVLVDDPRSWIVPYAERLAAELSPHHAVELCFAASDVTAGDMLFLLGCTRIVPEKILERNTYNFVVHESDLPKGRGWSPVSWQVLEGRDNIPVALFEACEELDAGPVYIRDTIELNGTELLPEIKQKQGEKTLEMVHALIGNWPDFVPEHQQGEPTYYPKRTFKDDRLDTEKPLKDLMNHLRILDNDKHPGWFEYNGRKYMLKIEPFPEEE